MNLEVGKIYTFKMTSGEEMIAKVTAGVTGNYVHVMDPVSVAPGPQGMGLVPSLFTANPQIPATININTIAVVSETDETIQAKYIQATTGITVPDKKLILG